MDTNKVIEEYIKLREARELLKQKYEAHDKVFKSRMEEIENEISEFCKESKAESISSPQGTAYRTVQSRYWSGNWDTFKTFVRQNDALDLLERRIHQTNMKQWIEDHGGELPEGLNMASAYKIIIRKK